ncbi:MAG: efflux RND transporter periplasmic adaptor subunit [Deltaproteobacteria bacterium]|nr:efflux RND transporter periplasmic adaptor subunit [Deltaproteobacteria bacterium]
MRKTTTGLNVTPLYVLLFIFILVLTGCRQERMTTETDSTIPVRAEEVKKSSIQEFVTATGTVYAVKETMLKTEQAGKYTLRRNPRTGKSFAMGDSVAANTLLFSLENPEYVNQIAIDSKKLSLESAEREFTKQQSVYEKGGITLSEVKDAERALIDSRYNYDNAKISLAKLEIRAPFKGFIVDLPHFTSSQWVEVNTEVATLMDYSRLYAELTLPGKEMGRIKRNQNVAVSNYSQDKQKLEGMVTQISPALDPTSRMFKIKIEAGNKDLMLKPGMFVRADIIVQEKADVIIIPKDIILDRRGRKTVYIIQRGIALERRLELGIETSDSVEVASGLNLGDRLIIEGFETLRNRSRVKVIE